MQGGALGAALAAGYMYFGEERIGSDGKNDRMSGSYLGPDYSEKEIESSSRKLKAVYKKYDNFNDLVNDIAPKIADGNVVGWFQGRMEFGPRALGNRSILGDARNPEMQKKLNLKIKYREGFRPFAPSVLSEDVKDYFDLETDSPYMLLVAPLTETRRSKIPDNYFSLTLEDRLYCKRSDIQAITHIDFSARIQTVHKQTNPKYWELINAFKKLTGYGLIVNTSFNVKGEPMVCTPYDAYRCFMNTEMDYLVINNYIYTKTEQQHWQDKERWMVTFKKD
jgi:carbamoyltransferase